MDKGEEDPFSVESLTDFFRRGVENYNRLGAVAFPDLVHRLMAPCSSLHSVIHQWAGFFKNGNDPDNPRIYRNIQSAAEAVLREKAATLRDLVAKGASDTEQDALHAQLFYAMQIADALELEAAPQILVGVINPAFLYQWKPGKNFGILLNRVLFPQDNAPVAGEIPHPSP